MRKQNLKISNPTQTLTNNSTESWAKNSTIISAINSTDYSTNDPTEHSANNFTEDSSSDSPMSSTNSSNVNNDTSPWDWGYNITSSATSTTIYPSPSAAPLNVATSSLAPEYSSTNVTFSSATSDTLPVPSDGFDSQNPGVMGHLQLNTSVWKNTGFIIGIACSTVGLLCVVFGLAYSIYLRRKTRPSIHSLRVVSGYDFNGGSEDDHFSYMTWNKATFEPINAEKNSSTCEKPRSTRSSHRNSAATVYSNADEEEVERMSSFHHDRHEKGIAI